MTTITRDQMRPGQIVARVTTYPYRVLPATRRGRLRLTPIDVQWQLVRGRWRVRWRPPFDMLGVHLDGVWVAEEQDRRDEDGDHEWRAFDTWAEAIAYADRQAKRPM